MLQLKEALRSTCAEARRMKRAAPDASSRTEEPMDFVGEREIHALSHRALRSSAERYGRASCRFLSDSFWTSRKAVCVVRSLRTRKCKVSFEAFHFKRWRQVEDLHGAQQKQLEVAELALRKRFV